MISMSDTPETKAENPGAGPGSALGMAGTVLAVVALGVAVYLFVALRDARSQIATLQARLTDVATSADRKTKELDLGLAAVRGQTATIAERTGMTEAELEKTANAARQLREEQRKGQENLASLGGEVGKVKDDVAASKAAIEETQARLQHAIGDLGEQSGLIARNADELAALKRAGLREYYEFDVKKSKSPTPVGPVAVRLKDADAKRHKFNMVLVVDDVEIEKKDKTLLEPVQFYRKGSRQLNEIVVYSVQKDQITGYLSTPKVADAATASK
jgi:DNA repair exonuclease SbcCD ATPase subunit